MDFRQEKRLKKFRKLETRRIHLEKIREFISNRFFITELKIPKEHIARFLEFCESEKLLNSTILARKMWW